MKFLYSLDGGNIPVIKEYNIDSQTKCVKGQVLRVAFNGEIAHESVGGCIGVAAEDHTGEKDILNKRNDGTKILIDITRNGVYSVPAPRFTATGGSTSTFICDATELETNLANSKLVLVQKGENSENTDSVGSVRKIKSISISNGVATITVETGSKISVGDVYAVFPKYGYGGYVANDGINFSCAQSHINTDVYVINHDMEALTLEILIDKAFI